MSLSGEGLKAFRTFLSSLLSFCPFLFSLPLFFILYNNVYYGNLILIALILLNLSVFVISKILAAPARAVSASKFASLCVISIVSAVLVIETLFPFMWPRDTRVFWISRKVSSTHRCRVHRVTWFFLGMRSKN